MARRHLGVSARGAPSGGVVGRAAHVGPFLGFGGADLGGLPGGGDGVAAEKESPGRVVVADDVDDDPGGAGGVAGLGAVGVTPVAVDGAHGLLVVGADGVDLHG